MKNKKASFPTIEVIAILFTTSVLLILFAIILLQSSNLVIEDQKTKTQIAVNNIFYSNCFSEQFGTIDEDKFTQENLDKCFQNADITDENLLLSIFLTNIEYSKNFGQFVALGKNNEFNEKKELCNLNSNILCSEIRYPIIYNENSGKSSTQILILRIITN